MLDLKSNAFRAILLASTTKTLRLSQRRPQGRLWDSRPQHYCACAQVSRVGSAADIFIICKSASLSMGKPQLQSPWLTAHGAPGGQLVFIEHRNCIYSFNSTLLPDDFFRTLSGEQSFPRIDFANAYVQVGIKQRTLQLMLLSLLALELLAINTHKRLHQYNRLSLGIKSTAAISGRRLLYGTHSNWAQGSPSHRSPKNCWERTPRTHVKCSLRTLQSTILDVSPTGRKTV